MATQSSAAAVRLQCRSEKHTENTVGLAPGYVQCNLMVLPIEYAADFISLCERNPVPFALLATSRTTGDPHTLSDTRLIKAGAESAAGDSAVPLLDLRTDLPRYNVYSCGSLIDTPNNVKDYWTESHTAFIMGCSFSFDSELVAAGLPPRHVEAGCNVTMYTTTYKLHPAGIFTEGTMVVSMRPYKESDIPRVRAITGRFSRTHGEPVDWGWDALERLGIKDLEQPDFGDVVGVRRKEGEVPVFWGCGATPSLVIKLAGDKIKGHVITHIPGFSLLVDLKDDEV
ncbi:hypothetical protein BPOR_1353g00010 [Botrytis porri]|uniref:DUF1445 domain-containing protein n=1 Tax=Botrytis porri TaxID=87229 RepID=A0A4Z1KI08_9HELO|nr:hypothetical protein BPOR_1353g00010 [Botrytis porri]